MARWGAPIVTTAPVLGHTRPTGAVVYSDLATAEKIIENQPEEQRGSA